MTATYTNTTTTEERIASIVYQLTLAVFALGVASAGFLNVTVDTLVTVTLALLVIVTIAFGGLQLIRRTNQ